MVIAQEASQGEIFGNRGTEVFLGDDVVNLVSRIGKRLRHEAILAAVLCSTPNKIPHQAFHRLHAGQQGAYWSERRALDLMMPKKQVSRSKPSISSFSSADNVP